MIAYEIQLRYVIRDKIQSKTKFSPRQDKIQSDTKFSLRQNLVQDKFSPRQIQSKTKFSPRQNPIIFFFVGKRFLSEKRFCLKKILGFCLGPNFAFVLAIPDKSMPTMNADSCSSCKNIKLQKTISLLHSYIRKQFQISPKLQQEPH